MSKNRIALARDVQAHLLDAERQHDLSMASSARLALSLLEGSLTLGAAACVGQEAIEKIVGYMTQQVDGRRTLVEAHSTLAAVRTRVGVPERMTGGGAPKNPDQFFTSAQLSVVETAAA